MAVQMDIVEGTAASHKLIEGWTYTRVAMCINLNPLGVLDTAALISLAESEVEAITGPRGSEAPNISVPTYLEEFIPEVINQDTVKMRIVYKGYPLVRYEVDGCLNSIETNIDQAGNPITVSYQYPADYAEVPWKQNLVVVQGGLIQSPIPEPSFTVAFVVASPTFLADITVRGQTYNIEPNTWSSTDIVTVLGLFLGTVNNAAYAFGRITGLAHTWLVSRFRALSRDGGLTYEVAMTFQYRQTGWDQIVTFINPDDGHPPGQDVVVYEPYDHASGTFTFAYGTKDSLIGQTKAFTFPESDFITFEFATN